MTVTDIDDKPDTLQARIAREKRRRGARTRITRGREYVLADVHPEILRDDLTANEVADYFGISRSTLLVTTRRHAEELQEVGFVPGAGPKPSRYSRRSVMHLALIMRPATSKRANQIATALGVRRGTMGSVGLRVPLPEKVLECRALLARSYEVIEAVRQQDPIDVAAELSAMSKRDLQSMVVALSALVPIDTPDLRRWLAEMGSRYTDADDSSAMGLALLIPDRKRMADTA
ncbi:MAG: hypothetical protein CK431_10245 [Mycobacterium sp.]|nr:MAG: hypothetical protein CK431_10245 [Mycobacterium sp.]